LSDSSNQATASATQAAGESSAAAPSAEDLAPIAIAVETVSANGVTLAILALLASGLAFAGIDRAKPKPPNADAEVEAEPPLKDQ
jgi:hypothetical protein